MTTLFLTDEREELFIEAGVQRKVAQSVRAVFGKDHCTVHNTTFIIYLYMYTFLVGSSWTGLSGVYNILDHYEHEQKRAVEYISTMHKAMNGVENFTHYSPTHVLKELSQDKLSR